MMKSSQVYKILDYANASGNNSMDGFILGVKSIQAGSILLSNFTIFVLYYILSKERRNVSNFLIFFQSIGDTFIGMMMCLEIVLYYIKDYVTVYSKLQLICTGMLEYSLVISLGTLLLCAIERYLSVNKPIFHKYKITKCRTIIVSIVLCLIALGPPLCLLFLSEFQPINTNEPTIVVYSLSFNSFIFSLLIAVITTLTMTLENARYSIQPRDDDRLPLNEYRLKIIRNTARVRQKKECRLVKIFLLMIVVYILTYSPLIITRFLYDFRALDLFTSEQDMVLIALCKSFYKSSALFNPLLTILLKRDFRRTARRSVRKRKSFSSMFESQKFFMVTTYV